MVFLLEAENICPDFIGCLGGGQLSGVDLYPDKPFLCCLRLDLLKFDKPAQLPVRIVTLPVVDAFRLFTLNFSLYTHPMSQYFTLQQANESLNIIRPLMDEVQAIREKIMSTQPEAWTAIEKSVGNGGSRALSKIVQDFEKLDILVHQILDTGVLIKDVNIGLLDFPALKDGREVYLCWQYGEGEIAFWHEIEAGYAGRQPISTF